MTWILGVCTVALAVASAYLIRQQGYDRKRLREAEARRAAVEQALAATVAERDRLRQEQRLARARMAEAADQRGPDEPPPVTQATASNPSAQRRPRVFPGPARPLPHAAMRMSIWMGYGDMIQKLGLERSDADALADVLAEYAEREQTLRTKQNTIQKAGGDDALENEAIEDEAEAEIEALAQEKQGAIATLLGPQLAEQWADMESQQLAHMEVRQLQRHFENVGIPLSEDQKASLLTVMADMQPPSSQGAITDKTLEAHLERNRKHADSLRAWAATELSPEQAPYMDEYAAWLEAMNELMQQAQPLEVD